MAFQIHALATATFESLFAMSNGELAKHRAKRLTVDSKPGYPCRVSLADAEIGATFLLVNFEHLAADTPYRSALAVCTTRNAFASWRASPGPDRDHPPLAKSLPLDGGGRLAGYVVNHPGHAGDFVDDS
jgi:hypothetical protein